MIKSITPILSWVAFLLGAIIVSAMISSFMGQNMLALMVSIIIAVVFSLGFFELLRFQQATQQLTSALQRQGGQITELTPWIDQLPHSLQHAVSLRISGERAPLPGPVLTPYLVGLLVMLGLLGTFIGMVDTLKGAVIALESDTELSAVRAGLAAPIKGLGLAFGSSVAGVAASAVLGFISTLSRRDRVNSSRVLDQTISTQLQRFSASHQRQQSQAAMISLAEQFSGLAEHLGKTLLNNQNAFHDQVSSAYQTLATSVDKSLQESLTNSGRMAAESLQPIVQAAMDDISTTLSEQSHAWLQHQKHSDEARLAGWQQALTQTQTDTLQALKQQSDAVSNSVKESQQHSQQSVHHISQDFAQLSTELQQQWQTQSHTQSTQQQALYEQMQHSAQLLNDSAQKQGLAIQQHNDALLKSAAEIQQQRSKAEELWLNQQQQQFQQLNTHLSTQMRDNNEQLFNQQSQASAALIEQLQQLTAQQQQAVESRSAQEHTFQQQQQQHLQELNKQLHQSLQQLHEDEAQRGDAAIARLSDLETHVSHQLGQLGASLEQPMSRLIETASAAPEAAAEVIEQLRAQISKSIASDNALLEDRQRIMQDLQTVSHALQEASTGQREAAELLVNSSTQMLENAGLNFSQYIHQENQKLSATTDQFAIAAVEMSSLSAGFTQAVEQFNTSNTGLVDKLTQIEQALDQSASRHDEQLAYYVAQARELIDHSMLSQKEIFEELRQISRQPSLLSSEHQG